MFELNDPVRDNAAPTVIRHCPLVYSLWRVVSSNQLHTDYWPLDYTCQYFTWVVLVILVLG